MTIERLDERTMTAAAARRPGYDRAAIRRGVVHLGLGAFARAHLAEYLDDLAGLGESGLGLVGVSLRSDDVRRALGPQDGLYVVGAVSGAAIDPRIVASVLEVLHAPSQAAEVRAALASPDISIVTITVTEKGYCWEPSTRRLDVTHPDIEHDLADPSAPRTLVGLLVRAAADRRAHGTGGFTALSLDNLPANGTTLRSVVLEFAARTDPTLPEWIEEFVRFPCSMVDRLVPATDDTFRQRIDATVGVHDAWPVRCEPYKQWVVETDWAGPIPPLAEVGVAFVDDVAPWETLKLRVLNGMHTAAAHYGLRHGLTTVDQVVASAAGRDLLERVAREVTPVLAAPAGVDPVAYAQTTLSRFSNAALGHRCDQIANDTSQKLPQRLLETVRARYAKGLAVDAIAEVLALWAWSTLGLDSDGAPREIRDPLVTVFAEIASTRGSDPSAWVAQLLSIESIFGDLAGNAALAAAMVGHLAPLMAG